MEQPDPQSNINLGFPDDTAQQATSETLSQTSATSNMKDEQAQQTSDVVITAPPESDTSISAELI